MTEFTYETDNRKNALETFEWDNVWLSHADEPERKRVLYIGDSISCGTRNIATQKTKDEWLFDGFGTSKAIDNPYFCASLKLFAAQEGRRDAVIFNNGLHGWHLTDDTEYGAFYEEMVQFLMHEFSDTPLFLVLSTHVADDVRDARVVKRNEAVKKIAEKYTLSMIDLYTVSKNAPHLLSADGVHFTQEGYELLAEEIIRNLQ